MAGVFTKFVARGLFCRNIVLRQLTTSKSIASSNARFISNAEKFRKPNYKYSLHREPGISELNDIERFLRKQRIKGALYSAEVNAQATDGFWARIVKAGDPDLVERYLNMTARLGLPINPEKILKDLRDAGLTPTSRVYGSFIHHSCSAGDMNRTSHYLGMLQSAGFKPTRFIFSQILHGYVKARLPEEVISTQELLSQIGLWPSKFAYEGLLFAYADIGDEESLLRTLDEAYTVLPSITDNQETEYSNEISASVLLDIYTRLICSLPNTNATCNEILKKLSAMDRFPFDFAIDSVKVLLAKGRPDAALEIFKINYSHERNNNHLSSLPTYAVAGGLTPKALEPFWEAADLDSKELLILRNKCKLQFNRTGKTNELGNQFQSCLNENNIEGGLNLLKNLSKTNISLAYSFILPKLIHLGYSIDNLIEQTEDIEIKKALAFGYILHNLSSIQSTDDVKSILNNCLELINKYRTDQLLPYNDMIRLGNAHVVKLLTSIISVSDVAEIANTTKSAVMYDIFSILNQTLTKRALRSLFVQIFEALLLVNVRSFHGIPKTTVIQLVADVCAQQNITFPHDFWLLSQLKVIGVPKHIMEKITSEQPGEQTPITNLSVLLFGAVHKNANEDSPAAAHLKPVSKESVPAAAESLVKTLKTNPENLEAELMSINKSWGLQKKSLLLCYLVNLGSDRLVDRVLQFIPDEHKQRLEPMKSFACIIRSSLTSENATKEPTSDSVKQSIENLKNLSSNELYSTMRGPHLDTLFRCWPTEHISDLIDITKKLSTVGLNSVSLQLAGVLINRGLKDLISTVLEKNKTVPFTFLVGNPRNPLTESALLHSLEYLKTYDSKHIPNFVDHCLRNAALSTNDESFCQLIRTLVSPPFNMDLLQICIQPTLQVLYQRLNDSKNLPEDILQATNPIIQKMDALKTKASN